MYTLIHQIGFPAFLKKEFPAFFISWILAEVIYKFGSFTLECAAFLFTWYVLSRLQAVINKPAKQTREDKL